MGERRLFWPVFVRVGFNKAANYLGGASSDINWADLMEIRDLTNL